MDYSKVGRQLVADWVYTGKGGVMILYTPER